ncbi:hypothetical protein PNOK_0722300 [Pyrrhoderma noxium]|uniref:Uncharacterized protein n=1 Tax=Pyrrhoderma noxium TaxID=2282107 RepID=A0A286UC88_9AGAM|nr:hypothetical protein PNOK_0722300 [Pyrrhoderma noxium]
MSHHITQDHWQETSNKKKEYVQPDGFFASSLWRLWIKTKTTFALSMMEPWEILLIFVITITMTMFVTVGLFRYFPHSIVSATRRANYYFSGADSFASAAVESFKSDDWMTNGRSTEL